MNQTHADTGRQPVLVGVDGSDRNLSAVRWAAREAVYFDVPLRLMCVLDEYSVLSPELHAVSIKPWAYAAVERAERIAHEMYPELDVRTVVTAGVPEDVLTVEASSARLLVLGRHGAGRFARMLLGSTTTTAAAQSPVSVAVVPADWPASSAGPVVVGLDPEHVGSVLQYAFTEADRRGATLRIVHGWQVHPEFYWDATAVSSRVPDWEHVARTQVQDAVEPWAAKYPDVPIEIELPHAHPTPSLVTSATAASLLMVGAHHRPWASGHQRLGSVARGVLHHASVPVMIVRES